MFERFTEKRATEKKRQPETWARRKFCNENLRWWEKMATQNYCLNSEITKTEKTTEKRQPEKWAVALFSYHLNSCCRIFSLPNFLLPLFHTLILFCPVFRPCHFSLPILPIGQFSGCRFSVALFFRCRFYLLLFEMHIIGV